MQYEVNILLTVLLVDFAELEKKSSDKQEVVYEERAVDDPKDVEGASHKINHVSDDANGRESESRKDLELSSDDGKEQPRFVAE